MLHYRNEGNQQCRNKTSSSPLYYRVIHALPTDIAMQPFYGSNNLMNVHS